jgi:hypothetical protein
MKIIASILCVACLSVQAVDHEFKVIIDTRLIYTLEESITAIKGASYITPTNTSSHTRTSITDSSYNQSSHNYKNTSAVNTSNKVNSTNKSYLGSDYGKFSTDGDTRIALS